jgi:putative spermidine/putrescine transport system ATP-binding protein
MTVQENVEFGLKMQGVDSVERAERATEVLELLDIGELADRDPTTLSGGQQQRVGFARALAIRPRILLLDEPMTGLDAKLKERLQREIGALLDELDVTALYVTHDQEEAMVMCDRIAVMNDGVLEQIGSPRDIYETPENEFVAGFVGTANVLDARAENGRLDLGFHEVVTEDSTHRGSVKVMVRPDDIDVGHGPIEATVTELYYVGEEIRATVELPDGQELDIEFDKSMRGTATGDAIALDIGSENVHVIDSAG